MSDPDDDPRLKSLRAVWLSLPDEDPPERGLAELMAAARVKAEQMVKPTLWQRLVALLRRPPVFALATVLILIGGAIFIGQRRAQFAEPTLEQQREPERVRETSSAGSTAVMPPEPGAATGDAGATGEDRGGNASEAEAPALIPEKPLEISADPAVAKPAKKPPPATSGTRRPEGAKPKPKLDAAPAAENKAATKDDTLVRGVTGTAGGGGGAGDSRAVGGAYSADKQLSTDRYAAPADQNTDKAEEVAEPVAPPSSTASTTTKTQPRPPASRAPQYIAQAKSAAARGDCAAARVLMKRVFSEDAAAYRKALAGDSTLNKCVVAQ